MDLEHYRERLLGMERDLSSRRDREAARGRDQTIDFAADSADVSVADEIASREYSDAERDSTVLEQVRAALQRIDDGTFGQCIVDGGPIEEKRLDAVPWTPYCVRHQEALESAEEPSKPTL
jgi:DnaK suppressor protein